MLVLGRKVGEVIYLDAPGLGRIALTVVQIDCGKVRIGFEAPDEVKIFRKEIAPITPE